MVRAVFMGCLSLLLVGCISGGHVFSTRQAQQLVVAGAKIPGVEAVAATLAVENTTETHGVASGTLSARFVSGTYESVNAISLGDGFTVTVVRPIHHAGEEVQLPVRADFDLGNQGWSLTRFENTNAQAMGAPLSSFRNAHDQTTPDGKKVADLVATAIQLSGEIKAAQVRLDRLMPEYDMVINHGWITPTSDDRTVAELFPQEEGLLDKLSVHGFETDYAARFKSIAKPLFDRDMSAARNTINSDAAKLTEITAQLRNS